MRKFFQHEEERGRASRFFSWLSRFAFLQHKQAFFGAPGLRVPRLIATLWLVAGTALALFLFQVWVPTVRLHAITQWIQVDWSGGVGSNTTSEYLSSSNIDSSTPGEVRLAEVAGWLHESWKYRKPVTVSNGGVALSDFQIPLTILYDAEMQSDFDDIRFANAGGAELDYWMESKTDGVSANVWVEADALVPGDTTLYLYYGNGSTATASNGVNTFLFYDDFETFIGWTTQGSGAVVQDSSRQYEGMFSGHKTSNNDPSGAYKAIGQTLGRGFVFEAYINRNSPYPGGASDRIGVLDGSGNGYGYSYTHSSSTIAIDKRTGNSGSGNGSSSAAPAVQNAFVLARFTVPAVGAMTAQRYVNGVLSGTSTYSDAATNAFSRVYIFGGHNYWVDAMRIRKHAAIMPSTSIGAEEERFVSPGVLTSNIFDTLEAFGADWGIVNWIAVGPGAVAVRVRTSNDPGMAGAPAFGTCPAVVSGSDISTNTCVADGHRYVQYELTLTSASAETPQFTSFDLSFTATNSAPDTPMNVSPLSSATQVAKNPVLTGSVFSDPDAGDVHEVTEWQIDGNADFSSPEWTRTSGAGEESIQVTSANGVFANDRSGETDLAQAAIYYWRVRYHDDRGGVSAWSAPTNFVTHDPSAVGGGAACPNIIIHEFSVNGDAATTNSRQVTITLDAENAEQIIISEDAGFIDATYGPAGASMPFTLSEGVGSKRVYAQVKNVCRTGLLMFDDIVLGESTSVPEQTETTSPTEDVVTPPGAQDPVNVVPDADADAPEQEDDRSIGPIIVEEIPDGLAEVDSEDVPIRETLIVVPVPVEEGGERDQVVLVPLSQPENTDVYQSGYVITRSRVVGDAEAHSFATNLVNMTDNFYQNAAITFVSGSLAGETRRVVGYDALLGTISLDSPLPHAPQSGDSFTLVLPALESGFAPGPQDAITRSQADRIVADISDIKRFTVAAIGLFGAVSIVAWLGIFYALWRFEMASSVLFRKVSRR